MSANKSFRRRLIKTALWLAAIVVAVFALQIGLLAFPTGSRRACPSK
jgi:hypothetical protein